MLKYYTPLVWLCGYDDTLLPFLFFLLCLSVPCMSACAHVYVCVAGWGKGGRGRVVEGGEHRIQYLNITEVLGSDKTFRYNRQ